MGQEVLLPAGASGRETLVDNGILRNVAAVTSRTGEAARNMLEMRAGWSAAVADLISVIITTYNRNDALDAVLRSLARQTDGNFEIVVCDDGSVPPAGEVVEVWRQRFSKPMHYVWQENRGFRAAESRNRGLLASRGSYVVFL